MAVAPLATNPTINRQVKYRIRRCNVLILGVFILLSSGDPRVTGEEFLLRRQKSVGRSDDRPPRGDH